MYMNQCAYVKSVFSTILERERKQFKRKKCFGKKLHFDQNSQISGFKKKKKYFMPKVKCIAHHTTDRMPEVRSHIHRPSLLFSG